jgi:hypothetical protein
MTATTPVPIVVANHDGEKLRTTRRQPWSFLEGAFGGVVAGSGSVDPFGLGCCESAVASPLSPFCVLLRSFSPAGVLMAGLSMLQCLLHYREPSSSFVFIWIVMIIVNIHFLWFGVVYARRPGSRFLADVGDSNAPKKPEILRSSSKTFTVHSQHTYREL